MDGIIADEAAGTLRQRLTSLIQSTADKRQFVTLTPVTFPRYTTYIHAVLAESTHYRTEFLFESKPIWSF